MKIIREHPIVNKRVLLRVDFNVTLTPKRKIADDARITQALPTIEALLKHHNKLILISHLDRPKHRDPKYSLRIVAQRLQAFLPTYNVVLVDDFLSEEGKKLLQSQTTNQVVLLENIRFYEGEQKNDMSFAKQLATLGDVFVNDAFGVSHRHDASIISLPKVLPSYAGLLLEKEVRAIQSIVNHPKKPFVAIIGGAKISTKMAFLSKLIDIADYLLLGGGIANTFLFAQGKHIGKSLAEKDHVNDVKKLMHHAQQKHTTIVLPSDVFGTVNGANEEKIVQTDHIPETFSILDIGPETQAQFGAILNKAQTIVWNGPVGFCEEERFCRGTDFLYYTIAHNGHAKSLVGGGDTLAAISKNNT